MKISQFAALAIPPVLVMFLWGLKSVGKEVSLDETTISSSQVFLVTSVIDGDTFDIGARRYRLWGIDAPELRQKCYNESSFWLCGEVAAQKLREKIMGQEVVCSNAAVDRDGRDVAQCSLGAKDLSLFMVESGWAVDWPKHSQGRYIESERSARKAALGIFGKNAN